MNEYHLIISEIDNTCIVSGMTLDEIKEYVKNENINYRNYAVIKGKTLKDFKMERIGE